MSTKGLEEQKDFIISRLESDNKLTENEWNEIESRKEEILSILPEEDAKKFMEKYDYLRKIFNRDWYQVLTKTKKHLNDFKQIFWSKERENNEKWNLSENMELNEFKERPKIFSDSDNEFEAFQRSVEHIWWIKFDKDDALSWEKFTIQITEKKQEFYRWGTMDIRQNGEWINTWIHANFTKKILAEKKTLTIPIINISVSNDFSYADIPHLIVEIQEQYNKWIKQNIESWEISKDRLEFSKDFFMWQVETLKDSYEEKAKDIINMLNMPEWQWKDSVTKDARKIWSQRALNAYRMKLAYSWDKTALDSKYIKEISDRYEAFLFNNTQKQVDINNLPETYQSAINRLKIAKEKSENFKWMFSQEAAEYLASDDWKIFDYGDLKSFIEKTINIKISILSLVQYNKFKQYAESITLPERLEGEDIRGYNKRALFFIAWKLDFFIKRLVDIDEKRLNKQELDITENKFKESTKEELQDHLDQTIFNRSQAEIWRVTDIPDTFRNYFKSKDNPKISAIQRKLDESKNPDYKILAEKFREWVNNRFQHKWESIEEARKELMIAKKELENAGEEDRNERLRNLSQIQFEIGITIRDILYWEKFYAYWNSFTLEEMKATNLQNCVWRWNIMNAVMKNFFNIEMYSRRWKWHFFSILELENWQQVRLDFAPEIFEKSIRTDDWIQESERGHDLVWVHEEIYRSLIWKHASLNELSDNQLIYYYKKSLIILPENADVYNDLAITYRDIWDLKKWEKFIKEAINLDPLNFLYNRVYALILKDQKRFDEALNILEKVLEMDPNNTRALFLKGQVFIESWELKKWKTILDKILERNKENFSILKDSFDAYKKAWYYEEALEILKIAEKVPDIQETAKMDLVYFFGDTLLKLWRLKEARIYFNKILDKFDYISNRKLISKAYKEVWYIKEAETILKNE